MNKEQPENNTVLWIALKNLETGEKRSVIFGQNTMVKTVEEVMNEEVNDMGDSIIKYDMGLSNTKRMNEEIRKTFATWEALGW